MMLFHSNFYGQEWYHLLSGLQSVIGLICRLIHGGDGPDRRAFGADR